MPLDAKNDKELQADLIYRQARQHSVVSRSGVSEISDSSLIYDPNCPPGLQQLFLTDGIFLKPYSGPHVIGHFSLNNRFELLNADGKRIFMISNKMTRKSKLYLSDEDNELKQKFPVHMSVLNHYEDEIYQYYGIPGEKVRVGPFGGLPWGTVHRRWSNFIHCSLKGHLNYDVVIEHRRCSLPLDPKVPTEYVVEGHKKFSCFPSASTRKLYYGTFDCVLSPVLASGEHLPQIGQISSNLFCERLGYALPGANFPVNLNVYHKAVIIGALLVDIIKH